MDLLIFEPIYKERAWGGQNIATFFNRQLPKSGRIGESWEIVDRNDAQSVVSRGFFKGRTIRSLIQELPKEIMGPGWLPEKRFPVLVKWLDCQERLSLQVHPPATVGGDAKSENWYFVDTKPGAFVLAGFNEAIDAEEFRRFMDKGELEDCVHKLSTRRGDSFFIPSGRIHAIDGGNLILEIQENSDTTYRVYDWGRVGLDGVPRELHVEKSLQSIDFQDVKPVLIHSVPGEQSLVDVKEFSLVKKEVKKGDTLRFKAGEEACLLSLISGRMSLQNEDDLYPGVNMLLSYSGEYLFQIKEDSIVLITNQFT